ncbi:ATP-dependent DNA helicase UvrD1 [Streptomyces microflavus]
MALVCRDLDLDPKRFPPKSFSARSDLKNELIDEEDFAAQATDGFEKTLAQAYAMYQSRLREANALDFDDLIMTVNLLRAFPDVADHYRRRFRHVLVDEYQDTDHTRCFPGPGARRHLRAPGGRTAQRVRPPARRTVRGG